MTRPRMLRSAKDPSVVTSRCGARISAGRVDPIIPRKPRGYEELDMGPWRQWNVVIGTSGIAMRASKAPIWRTMPGYNVVNVQARTAEEAMKRAEADWAYKASREGAR